MNALAPFAPVVRRLLTEILYADEENHWRLLLEQRESVRTYFAAIGIDLVVDTSEGYAYLKQAEPDDSRPELAGLPVLIKRRKLTKEMTLLLVLLREKLLEFDSEMRHLIERPVITREEIRAMAMELARKTNDEVKLVNNIDPRINEAVEMKFLKKISESEFEIRRVLKARFDAQTLLTIKEKLTEHADDPPV